MNRKRKGTTGERDYRQLLEDEGFEVYRSSSSSGAFDLLALRFQGQTMELRAVQVKRYGERRGYSRKAILAALQKWAGMAWIHPQLAERADDGPWVITNAERDD